ncbi:hypothetical protein [Streptomyces sp. LUP30]|uniref:hypothetical protein n=1 Tax=Streptomyces sp. LUP30 TaxID=1890285 RepID=UPI00099FC5FE|nr:hypothetical protein [Streptomyces sp. LUP30]
MGVLARLFRRSKSVEVPATEEAATAADEASADATEDVAKAETVTEDSQETTEAASATHGEAAKEPVAASDDGADGVGIPRQQSPEETADSEAADEGART